MKRTYMDGRRIKSVREIPLGEWHHVMVVERPWWQFTWSWATWWLWYRWKPDTESTPTYTEEILTDWPLGFWPLGELTHKDGATDD